MHKQEAYMTADNPDRGSSQHHRRICPRAGRCGSRWLAATGSSTS